MKVGVILLLFSHVIYADTILATGTVESKNTQHVLMPLMPSFNGKLSEIVAEGTLVEKGDLLIRIDGAEINSQIEALQEQLETFEATNKKQEVELLIALNTAQIDFERADVALQIAKIKAEVALNHIGELAYKQNQLALKNAEKIYQKTINDLQEVKIKQTEAIIEKNLGIKQKQKKLKAQQDLLKNYTILADRQGYVINASHPWNGNKIQQGDQLQSGWKVLTVSKNTDLQIAAWINAIDIPHIKVGQQVNIQFDAFMSAVHKGKITTVSAGGGNRDSWGDGLYYQVIVTLDETVADKLLIGMSAMIAINIEGSHVK